jgi:predicted amidohydrolase YtcJ
MVFGLFRKNESADIIFTGGKVYTLDPDSPWAEAVACKDGRILAVGDSKIMDDVTGDDTKIVNLEGGTLLPGFLEVCGHPVLQAFQRVCLILYDDMTQDMVLSALSDYIKKRPENEGYFGYGFNTDFIIDKPEEEVRALLDKVCKDKPVALLDISGFHGWFNTKAMELVKAAVAEEAETPIVTLAYVLHVLSPIDFDILQGAIIELAAEYSKKGYTTIFDCGSPDYLHAIYQEMLIEMYQTEMLKQRLIGSLLIIRNIATDYVIRKLSQKRDSCAELQDFISCKTLKLIVNADANMDKSSQTVVTYDLLKILAIQASDKGFHFHIDAVGRKAVSQAFEAVFLARAAGYKKNHFVIAQSYGLSQEEKTELLLDNDLCETISTLGDFNKRYRGIENAKDVTDAIDKLTIDAAVLLGVSDDYGSIESGKQADFVIFRENPLECNLPRFRAMDCRMTVLGGNVVYDSEIDDPEKWYSHLRQKQKELQEQELLEEENF